MTGDALWEIFRKHLRQIETEGDDLGRLVKEVRQIRDQLMSVLSDSARTQEEMKDWFANMKRNPAEATAGDSESVRLLTEEKAAVLEQTIRRINKKLDEERTRAGNRITDAAQEFLPALEERFGNLETRLQTCQDHEAQMRRQISELLSSFESVREKSRVLEEFFERIYQKLTSLPEGNNSPANQKS